MDDDTFRLIADPATSAESVPTRDRGPQRFLVMYSGGLCSWMAAKRIAEEHGTENLSLLFADTIIEDDDLYRFLVQSAMNVYGIPIPPSSGLLDQIAALIPIEDESEGALDRRKAQLQSIRQQAMELIPGLNWIADGRTPWEVFVDVKYIGNSRVDPCSRVLKRELMNQWRDEHCQPETTTIVFGLDWNEADRIERHRLRIAPWQSVYPLAESPYMTKDDIRCAAEQEGIKQPRLYDLGFPHNNCGGMCCKAGLAQMKHFNSALPLRYRHHERKEAASMAAIGETAGTILRLRGGGTTRPVTMEQFRLMAEQQPTLYDDHGWGCGGGCAIDSEEDAVDE